MLEKVILLLFLAFEAFAIDYSMRSQSNLLDFDQQDDLEMNEGFREAADIVFGTIFPYLPFMVIAGCFIYFANKFFPSRTPKILKKLPIQKK